MVYALDYHEPEVIKMQLATQELHNSDLGAELKFGVLSQLNAGDDF